MAEDEIERLTADVNRFALTQGWLPIQDQETVWETWSVVKTASLGHTPTVSKTRPQQRLHVWEQCSTILNGLLQNRNAYLFSRPVDPVRDGVPNYFQVVKRPMDLGTVKHKLALNARRRHEPLKPSMYRCPSEFKADMDLIWDNCFLYNPPGYEVHSMGAALKTEFERRWKAMRIEETAERINKPKCNGDHVREDMTASQIAQATGKVLKKRKPALETANNAGKNKIREPQLGHPERKAETNNQHQHSQLQNPHGGKKDTMRQDPCSAPKTGSKVSADIKSNLAAGKRTKAGIRKQKAEANGQRKGGVAAKKLDRTSSQGRQMRKLLQSCKRPASKETSVENGAKQPVREWKPPIERGGDIPTSTITKPIEKAATQPPPPLPQSKSRPGIETVRKCRVLNDNLKKSLEESRLKSEDQMSDYEARRHLSISLETISSSALNAVVSGLIAKDSCFKNGESTIDAMDIGTVRKAVRIILGASRKDKRKPMSSEKEAAPPSEKPSSITQSISPLPVTAGNPPKRKRFEDEGCRLATKTPMVSPPSPPWHRRLTQKREVWDNAVGLCGVTPRQDGSELGLTPRQESNEGSWEEATPDDVEDGEILI